MIKALIWNREAFEIAIAAMGDPSSAVCAVR
jgi:hypothetical protein